MRDIHSLLKARNFIAKVGGRDNVEEIRRQYLEGRSMKEIARRWHMSEAQFNEYFHNHFQLVPVKWPEIKEYEGIQKQIEESENPRVEEAKGILRLFKSGDRNL